MPNVALEKGWILLDCIAAYSFDELTYKMGFSGQEPYLSKAILNGRTINRAERELFNVESQNSNIQSSLPGAAAFGLKAAGF